MKRISAISLLLLMLFTQMGMVVSGHFCMGEMVSFNIGMEKLAESCVNSDKIMGCMDQGQDEGQGESIKFVGCCSDSWNQISLDDNYRPSVVNPTTKLHDMIPVIVSLCFLDTHEGHVSRFNLLRDYIPLPSERRILFQSFLI